MIWLTGCRVCAASPRAVVRYMCLSYSVLGPRSPVVYRKPVDKCDGGPMPLDSCQHPSTQEPPMGWFEWM